MAAFTDVFKHQVFPDRKSAFKRDILCVTLETVCTGMPQEIARTGMAGWEELCTIYSISRKHQSTYLHYRGAELDINNVCETGLVFSNSVAVYPAVPPKYTPRLLVACT